MYCNRCGTALQAGNNFCAGCGNASVSVPAPLQSRVAEHARLLGILWLALSVFRLIPGLLLLTMFDAARLTFFPELPFFVSSIVHVVGFVFLGSAALGLFAGWGLLDRQPWARTLSIVLGCLSLPDMPFGTALGIFTLWVLLPGNAEEEYRRLATERAV